MAEPIVLLHGWGCGSASWAPIVGSLCELAEVQTIDLPGFEEVALECQGVEPLNLTNLVASIVELLPPRCVLMGWSLGGMLATKIASQYPERISSLVTLATNVSFVAGEHWPTAMQADTFAQFRASFVENKVLSLKRFMALVAQSDEREKLVLKGLRELLKDQNPTDLWLDQLDVLASIDNRQSFRELTVPGLHLLGECDGLVPNVCAAKMEKLNIKQSLVTLPGVGHAPHWSSPTSVVAQLRAFLETQKFHLDKMKVAKSFSKAANTYDTMAQLQRDVGDQLFDQHLVPSAIVDEVQTIVDLGCGTGWFTERLQAQFSGRDIVGLDLAEGMLRYAREHKASQAHWLCGDAESLPLSSNSVDLMFSSLAIQWCENTAALFAEIKRVLKPGGKFYFSTLGPKTLYELRSAWRGVDGDVHVNRFYPEETIRASVASASLDLLDWAREERVLYYSELKHLTNELKGIGAHNVNQGKPSGLTGRQRLLGVREGYEQFRTELGLPASYDVFYGVVSG